MSENDVQFFVKIALRQKIHALVSSVWLLYDLLTTLDEEVEFVWGSPNSLPKFLYLISRYGGLAGQLTYALGNWSLFCPDELALSLVLLASMLGSIELSLMLRIDALYGRSKRIRIFLLVGFLAEIISASIINAVLYTTVYTTLQRFPSEWPVEGCFFPMDNLMAKMCWIPILAFETLLFFLNTAKCISYGPLDHAPLIYRLFRDGSVYFAIVFAFMIVCTITQFLNITTVSSITSTWISAVLSYAGSHLLLSVRSVAAQRERLDLTLFSVHASRFHASEFQADSKESDSSADTPHPLTRPQPPRLSLARHVESIELIPRLHFVGLHPDSPSTSGQHTEESEESSRRRRSESQSDCLSAALLESGGKMA